jgi:hypothetical protein
MFAVAVQVREFEFHKIFYDFCICLYLIVADTVSVSLHEVLFVVFSAVPVQ